MTESIYKSEIERKLLEIFETTLEKGPFRIVDLDCRLAGKSLLRIFIERPETGTASIQDCAEVSRLLDPVIENAGVFTGPFELEVSSPGIDRRLRLLEHFQKAVGAEVKLDFTDKVESLGGSTRGILEKVVQEGLCVKTQGKEIVIGLGQIKKAQAFSSELKARV